MTEKQRQDIQRQKAEKRRRAKQKTPPEPTTAEVPLDEPMNPLLRESEETIRMGRGMYQQVLSSLMERGESLTDEDKANLQECCRLEAATIVNRPYFRVGRKISMFVRDEKGELVAPFLKHVDPRLEPGDVEIIDGDEVISTLPEIAIRIYYLVTVPYQMMVSLDRPFTRELLMKGIFGAYGRIYKEEREWPACITGTLNRPKTNGRYGIFGHNVTDLHILRVYEVEPGIFVPEMGS